MSKVDFCIEPFLRFNYLYNFFFLQRYTEQEQQSQINSLVQISALKKSPTGSIMTTHLPHLELFTIDFLVALYLFEIFFVNVWR